MGISERERESRCQGIIIRCSVIVVDSRLVWAALGETLVKKGFISAAAVFGFATAAHAGELSDIQEQSRQLREQNQALTKRIADLERRQRKLEAQPVAKQPADSMAADYPGYKAEYRKAPPANDSLTWNGITLYGLVDMGVTYQNHAAPLSSTSGLGLNY